MLLWDQPAARPRSLRPVRLIGCKCHLGDQERPSNQPADTRNCFDHPLRKTRRMNPATVNTPSETQVEVVRSFDAPVDSVWNAFTVPELVKQWMLGPPGWSMPVCDMDFRVGGRYENRFRNEQEGTEFGLVGEFREIESRRKIVQDENYGLGNAWRSLASAPALGAGGRRFESFRPDAVPE